jgi:hypothetical protein
MAVINISGLVHGPEWQAVGRETHFRALSRLFRAVEIDLGPHVDFFAFSRNCEGVNGALQVGKIGYKAKFNLRHRVVAVDIPFYKAELFVTDSQFADIVVDRFLKGWQYFCEKASSRELRFDQPIAEAVIRGCLETYRQQAVKSVVTDEEARYVDLLFGLEK